MSGLVVLSRIPLLLALALTPVDSRAAAPVEGDPFTLEDEGTVRPDAPLRGRIVLGEPLGAHLEILLDGERVLHTRGSRDAADWWLADPEAEVHLVEPEIGVLVWSYRPGSGFVEGEHTVTLRVDGGGEPRESEPLEFRAIPASLPAGLYGTRAIPNPLSPVLGTGTTLHFTTDQPLDVRIRVWDREGEFVTEIFRGSLPAGDHQVSWDGRSGSGTALANGVYLVRFEPEGVGSGWPPVVLKVAVWNER